MGNIVKICNNCKDFHISETRCGCGSTTLTKTHPSNFIYAKNLKDIFFSRDLNIVKISTVFKDKKILSLVYKDEPSKSAGQMSFEDFIKYLD